jgi:hypothetical protein
MILTVGGSRWVACGDVGQAQRRVFVPLKHDAFGLLTTQRREHLVKVKAPRSDGW